MLVLFAFMILAVSASPAGAQGLHAQVGAVRIFADGTAGGGEVAAVSVAAARLVQARGWRPPATVIRILDNPHDATAPSSDLALGAHWSTEDAFFLTVEALIRFELGRTAPPPRATTAARLVAAHLSPPGSSLRQAWESQWVASLARGELTETALLETVWRAGGDRLVRQVASRPWPEGLVKTLAEHLDGDPLEAVTEVVLAGLLDPARLGFRVAPPPLPAPATAPLGCGFAGQVGFGVHFHSLPARAAGEGVLVLRRRGVSAHVVVRYPFPGQYDAARLADGEELAVPLRGVSWAGIVVTSLADGGALSLASRPLPEYPVALQQWDFTAGDGNVTISWETRTHEDLLGFVVEALARDGQRGWYALRRQFLPVAASGKLPFSYSFVEPGGGDAEMYRLAAVTSQGFLAELGVFPILSR